MVGVTVTSARTFGLKRSIGKGPKLLAALLESTSAETLETGMQKVESATIGLYGALADETAKIASVSNGQITFACHKMSDHLTAATDVAHYIMVVGTMEKATK